MAGKQPAMVTPYNNCLYPDRRSQGAQIGHCFSGEECSGLIDARIRACRRRERLIDKTAPQRR
jgi:hypothetical protein